MICPMQLTYINLKTPNYAWTVICAFFIFIFSPQESCKLWTNFHHLPNNSVGCSLSTQLYRNLLMLNPAQTAHNMGVLWDNPLIVSILDVKQLCLIRK